MTSIRLTDEQWAKIRDFLKEDPNAYLGNEAKCRQFLEAVIWICRSGAQWRLLPSEYGKWNSVYARFARWADKGVWQRMMAALADDPDMENGLIDSTIVRAHPCAAGAQKSEKQALGRSRGGFSSKIHITVDGLGNPLRFRLSPGQAHDINQASALLQGFAFQRVIADRGYAAQDFVNSLLERGIEVVIPPHPRAKEKRDYDKWLYRERHLVECFINKIKHFRRVFSRYEKLDTSYLGFLHLVGTLIWLR